MSDEYDQYLQAEGFDINDPATKTGNTGSSLGIADDLLKLGTGIATTARDWNKPAPAPVRAAAPAQQAAWVKPALIGGGILLALAVLGLLFKGKG